MKPEFKIRKWSDPDEGRIKVLVNITFADETINKIIYEHGCFTSCWKVKHIIDDFVERVFRTGHLSRCKMDGFFSDETLVLKTFEFYMSEIEFKEIKDRMRAVSEDLGSRQSMKNAFAKHLDCMLLKELL